MELLKDQNQRELNISLNFKESRNLMHLTVASIKPQNQANKRIFIPNLWNVMEHCLRKAEFLGKFRNGYNGEDPEINCKNLFIEPESFEKLNIRKKIVISTVRELFLREFIKITNLLPEQVFELIQIEIINKDNFEVWKKKSLSNKIQKSKVIQLNLFNNK